MRLSRHLLLALGMLSGVACSDKVAEPEPPPKQPAASGSTAPTDPKELVKEDLTVGTGDRAVKQGDEVKVNYVGRLLKTGAMFDSNTKKDDPFEFTVGEGVIEGWSQGVIGMKKGGKRKLTIPSDLAYGAAGSGKKIPPNSALVFEIDLLGWADEKDAAPGASASASPATSGAPSAAPSASASAKAAPTTSAKAGSPPEKPKAP